MDLTGKNLPLYGVKSTNLRDFTTKKKDLKKGISRIPLQTSRIWEEDIAPPQEENSANKK